MHIILSIVISYILCLTINTTFNKYAPLLPILYCIFMVAVLLKKELFK